MSCKKLFVTLLLFTITHQSFSMTPDGQPNLNKQLIIAILHENNAEVASLLQAGAQVNAKDGDDWAPLHWAVRNCYTAIVELLLSHGADIHAKDNDGRTPLHLAAMVDHAATVRLLLTKGANIHAKDLKDDTPLHEAAQHGTAATVELLIAHGADIKATNSYGHVPHFGVNTAATQLLKANKALMKQAKRPTPRALLKEAIEQGYYGLVKLLLQRGLKPEITDLEQAKQKWQTDMHKEAHKAIGRLLVAYLRLMGELKASESSENNQTMSHLVGIMTLFRRDSTQSPLSKTGIVGLYGLPVTIAQEIAQYCNSHLK